MGIKFKDLKKNSPERYTDEAILTLKRGYLLEEENPNGMIDRLCDTTIKYYPNGYNGFPKERIWNSLQTAFRQCWLSPASPVAANFGSKRGLPVSCYGASVPNSIFGIFETATEIAMLTKNGGGIGLDLSDLIGDSPVTAWAQLYDKEMSIVSQSGVRRGSVALYLDIEHPDIDLFLHSKDLTKGDIKSKLQSNIAVKISDDFMLSLPTNEENRERFIKVIELRMKYGSPYIYFTDNVLKRDPEWYKNNNLSTKHSQLCSEIFLHSDKQHTYNCVLSSMNLRYYDEWKNLEGISLPELSIVFLDAVCQEFIEKVYEKQNEHGNKQGLEKALLGAVKGRPLGLGVFGFHAYLMSKGYPFGSVASGLENNSIFKYIREEAEKATMNLAREKGEPEWCRGYKRRNTHLIAIAPTTTSSVLANGVSPGIEPIMSNCYSFSGAKGTFIRKNPFLEELLEKKGKNKEYVWNSIRNHNGSVQHLEFLSEEEKEVFKTFSEIEQLDIIRLAALRQRYIDQGQSLNLFIKPTEDAQKILDIHIHAWKLGLKSLYYVRSESFINKRTNKDIGFVYIKTRETCNYCKKAKALLKEYGIPYVEDEKLTGRVPEIWIKGNKLLDGYNSLVEYLDAPTELLQKVNLNCSGCDG